MNYNRIKNDVKISVKKWDNKITLTDVATGKVLAIKKFSDHIQAVTLAKAL